MRRPRLYSLVIVLTACLQQSAVYDAGRDDDAVTALTRRWTGGNGAALSLCEDVATAASHEGDGCQIENVARGGGLGSSHSEPRGGCGGCPLGNEAFMTGTVSGGGLPAGTAVAGSVFLGSGYDDDPYNFPYTLDLTCTDTTHPCTVTGTLEADGSLQLTIDDNLAATPGVATSLTPAGAATCSAP